MNNFTTWWPCVGRTGREGDGRGGEAGSISSWIACMEYGEVCRLPGCCSAAAAVSVSPARLVWIADTDFPLLY